ncbi:MAG: type II toxin-antitoxin system VapC family toxin [Alphaproteobacteria bacterium]|nr:type II toxin-antitoxin system VapC family toxin [Alphaproteobacteria bacterium]
MSFLIDTNVISELRRGERCDSSVAEWWKSVHEGDLFLSALIVGEIRKGIEIARRKDTAKADALQTWLAATVSAFGDRIIPVDAAVADAWGRMSAQRTVPVVDGLLAATAMVHDLTLVTRNAADVMGLGAKVLDPFRPPKRAPS